MRIGITGATGFVGRRLASVLVARGDEVVAFTRSASRAAEVLPRGVRTATWQPSAGPAPAAELDGLDGIVHLAGESISSLPWTAERRRRILSSRREGTRSLVDGLALTTLKPGVLISGSAVGYYGDRGDQVLDETAPPGTGFLAGVCRTWEDEAIRAESLGIRTVRLRTGLVLGSGGGVLPVMATPFLFGLGGRLGSGRQWMSWIHLEDLVGLVLFALADDSLRGPVNATSPNPVRNSEFTQELARALHRPALFAVPSAALRLVLGDAGDELLLASQRAVPSAGIRSGFRFAYPDLRPALSRTLAR